MACKLAGAARLGVFRVRVVRVSESLAWRNNCWVPFSQAGLALDDFGVLQSAMLVDRLRTCRGVPLDVEEHVQRLCANANALGIELPTAFDLKALLVECAEKNAACFEGQDFSLVSLITPGRSGAARRMPTIIVHAAPIPWSKLDDFYQRGQDLIVAEARNVPNACWPTVLKTRARLHYYLADRQAELRGQSASTGAVLLDLDGFITDTSTANLLLIENQALVASPADSCYEGFSLQRTLRLASELRVAIKREPISVARAQAARHVILCGSVGSLWTARSLAGQPLEATGRLVTQLQAAWAREIGIDFVEQAHQMAAHKTHSEDRGEQ